MMENKRDLGFYGILAAALLAVAGAGWFFFSKARGGDTPAPAEAPAETVRDMTWLSELEGNYAVREISAGDTTYSSASLRKLPEGAYELVKITVYGPVHYPVQVFGDGSLLSEDLGAGFAGYDPALGVYTLRFEKDKTVCELTR